MLSDEKRLEPLNDTLNQAPPRFGMPWYVVLGIISFSVILFMVPVSDCKIAGLVICPAALGFGWWLCKDDPKAPVLIYYELMLLPAEYDPGK